MLRLILMASALFLPTIAVAQPVSGPYVGAATGVNLPISQASAAAAMKIDIKPGPLGVVSLGWGFGNGVRTEIEASYRSNDINGAAPAGQSRPLSKLSGSATTRAVMANVIYDLPLHPFGLPVQPYIGVGIGYGWLNFGNVHGDGFTTVNLPNNVTLGPWANSVSFGSASALAYQSIVGASLPLGFLPGLSLTLEYRFFGMAHVNIPVTGVVTGGPFAGRSSRTQYGFQALDNTVLIGLRYAFGGP